MTSRNSVALALSASLAMTPATSAGADDAAKIIAGAAAIGLGIALYRSRTQNNQNVQSAAPRPQPTAQPAPPTYNPQRERNREVQSALNAFDFNVGAVDGRIGPNTRAGISAYQAHMGFPVTGQLEQYQRDQLTLAHKRLQNGDGAGFPETLRQEGNKGLLKAFADPTYEDRLRTAAQPVPAPKTADELVIRPIGKSNDFADVSMAYHCELVAGITQINQGITLASNIADPDQALGEQFCDARSYAMTQSQSLMTRLDIPDDEIENQCVALAEALEPAIAEIGSGDLKQVAAEVQTLIDPVFGGDMPTAAAYGSICLGIGYRRDEAHVALGGAALKLAGGELPFAEILGHHQRWGFGLAANRKTSDAWYKIALDAMERGAPAAFYPSKTPVRNNIIRAAIAVPPVSGEGTLRAAAKSGLSIPPLDLSGN
jgi:peptidoglycan hydrolase-like protein with peptidoglycan-binding domain